MPKRILILMISAYLWGIESCGKAIFSVFSKKIPGRCVVLYYHSVTSRQCKRFSRQMDIISSFAKTLSPNKSNKIETGEYHVALTFDDAFHNVAENALPVLAHLQIPCTVFVPTGHIGKQPTWLKNKHRDDVHHRVMDADMLRKINKNDLFTIGSHCVTHSSLTSMSYDNAKQEILESKGCLENILNEEIKTISFPHGAYDQTHVDLAREAGYERVFTILPSLAFMRADGYETGRVRVDPDDWMLEFRLKILGAYRWLPVAFDAKRALLRHLYKYLQGQNS